MGQRHVHAVMRMALLIFAALAAYAAGLLNLFGGIEAWMPRRY